MLKNIQNSLKIVTTLKIQFVKRRFDEQIRAKMQNVKTKNERTATQKASPKNVAATTAESLVNVSSSDCRQFQKYPRRNARRKPYSTRNESVFVVILKEKLNWNYVQK